MSSLAGGLRAAFVGALDDDRRATFERDGALDDHLGDLLARAHEAADAYAITDLVFLEHVARVLAPEAGPEALMQLRAGDLYLACACAAGDGRALGVFDREFGRDIDLAIARSGNLDLAKDEFRQLLRDKLFVPRAGKRPKIAEYAGRGDLRSWVRVTALRAIVDLARQRAGDKEVLVEIDMLGAVPASGDDPELDYIQRVYRSEFKEALQAAFTRLSPRERNLLRHQVVYGLNIDQIGALYHVHRTTAFRWLEKARKSLLRETRTALVHRLRVGTGEFTSIMRVVQGDLDVSMRRLLVSEIEEEEA